MSEENNVVDISGTPADAESAAIGDNSRQAEAAKPFLENIEAEQAKIDAIMEDAKKQCAPMRATIAEKKKEMRTETGVDAKAANNLLSLRKVSRRVSTQLQKQSENTREDFKVLWSEMGQGCFDIDSILSE